MKIELGMMYDRFWLFLRLTDSDPPTVIYNTKVKYITVLMTMMEALYHNNNEDN